ncbi:probable proteasome inhibitor [Actinidia eriantha]|uniref:probable proteasome inhibitor n=1 Tax=Actinidia eriantha TaxID=165200 RepID=UPI002583C944|nr:probable proteasome inhibitor [Actinidia eriantha]
MAFHDAVMGVIREERPSFRNPLDKMAFAVHASFIASGYILLATGPDALAVLDPMYSQQPLTEVGIDGWDALDDTYAFIYSHPSNNPKRVFIRCVPVDAINEYLFVEAQSHRRSCWPFSVNILIRAFNDNYGRRNDYASQYRNFDKLVNLIDQMLLSQVNLHPSDPPSNQLASCLYHPLVPVIPVYWQPQTGTGVFHPSSVYGIGRGRFAGL